MGLTTAALVQHISGETYTLGTTPVWVRREHDNRPGVRC